MKSKKSLKTTGLGNCLTELLSGHYFMCAQFLIAHVRPSCDTLKHPDVGLVAKFTGGQFSRTNGFNQLVRKSSFYYQCNLAN